MSDGLLLGCDLALRKTGLVLVDPALRVVDLAVFSTAAPPPKKMRAAGELGVADRLASIELYRELRSWMSRADAVVYECAFSHFGRAATAGALARAAFAIAAHEEDLDVEGFSDDDVKVAAWGPDATKRQVAAGVRSCFGITDFAVAKTLESDNEDEWSHVFDALAVVMAGSRGSVVRKFATEGAIRRIEASPGEARRAARTERFPANGADLFRAPGAAP